MNELCVFQSGINCILGCLHLVGISMVVVTEGRFFSMSLCCKFRCGVEAGRMRDLFIVDRESSTSLMSSLIKTSSERFREIKNIVGADLAKPCWRSRRARSSRGT